MVLRTLQRAAFILLVSAGAAMVYACADQAGDSVTSPAAPTIIPDFRLALEAQRRHTDKLLAIPGVVGTALTTLPDGRAAMQIMVEHQGVPGLPVTLDGIPVSTEVTGRLMAFSDPRTRQRPAPAGYSVGHPSVTAGTIGARVRDAQGRVYILSNNHVLANSNSSTIGDPAYQPGPFDGGTSADQIATLFDFQVISFAGNASNTMDAAIALSSPNVLDNATPLDDAYGLPSSVMYGDANGDGRFDNPTELLGLAVQKYGRTTRLTRGTITGVNATVVICYEVTGIFCSKSARYVDQLIISPAGFSDGGDSGSLIVTDDDQKNPVALLFAGSATQTIANRIDLVLDRFDVTVDGYVPGPFTDISVTAVSAPLSVVVDSTNAVSVTLRNLGNQEVTDTFDVTLEDSTAAVTVGTQRVAGLAVGASATLSFDWTPQSSGSHRLIARQSRIDDRPANDENSATVAVGPPRLDVAVLSMTVPGGISEGHSVSIGVNVGNVGNLPAGSVVVTLRDTTDHTTIGTQTVSALAVSANATVTFTWNTTGATIGSHALAVSHDLADDDAANNQAVGNVTVHPPLTDISLTSFTGPASVRQGDTARFSATVRNIGEQNVTTPFDVMLTDATAGGAVIATGTVPSLAIGASATLDIAWNTAGAAITGHTIIATQMLADGNATNNARAIGITIQPPPPPLVADVSVTALSAPASISQGTTAGVSVTVQNVGQQSTGTPFTVTLTDSTAGVTIGTLTVNNLAVGAATTLTFSWNTTGAALGTHTLVATHNFTDATPANNRRTTLAVVTPQVIDIALTSFTGPSPVTQGETATYTVTIQNVGGANVTAGIPVQLMDATAGVPIGTQTAPGLAAGASATLSFAWNTAGVAVTGHTLIATQQLPDNNNTNNARAIGILIKPPITPLTDVAVTTLNSASSVQQGQVLNASVTVTNAGNQPVGSFVVTLTDATAGATIGTQTVTNLAVGANATVSFAWNTTGVAPGAHTLVASHSLTDGNAANNQRSATVTVNAVILDVSVASVTGPGSVTQGNTATIGVTVQNVGQQAAATPFNVVLTDATAGVTIGTQSVSSLALGTTASLSFTWNTTGLALGNHNLLASHTLADANASNNQRSATIAVAAPIVDVSLASFTGPAAVTQGDTARYTVTVQNAGGQNVSATFDAVLTDATTGLVIGTQPVAGLAPRASTAIEFAWSTAGVSTIGHTLIARHTLIDNNATNNSRALGVVVNAPGVHVGNMTGLAQSQGSTWLASVEIAVHDHAHRPVSGVTVRGSWGGPNVGECVTAETGMCTVTLALPLTTGLVSFGMSTMTAAGYVYRSASNHDPDGSSNGSTIFVRRP